MQHLTDQDFASEVVDKGGLAVVDFSASWCGPCRALAPHFEALANEKASEARFYKVDVDDAPDTAASYGIMSVPMVIFFKDGVPVDKSVGLVSKDALAKRLDEAKTK